MRIHSRIFMVFIINCKCTLPGYTSKINMFLTLSLFEIRKYASSQYSINAE